MVNTSFLIISIGVFALIINLVGFIVSIIANSRFHAGVYKQFVNIVIALVFFLNIHLILNVWLNTSFIVFGKSIPSLLVDHISFVLVIIVCIFTIIASVVNLILAREVGFKV